MTSKASAALRGGSVLLFLTLSAHAQTCSQTVLDGISRTNDALRALKLKYIRCAGVENNAERSECWRAFKMSNEDADSYEELDIKYQGLYDLCARDSILYNLGNYRQAFGRNCRAFDSFSRIRVKGRFTQLTQIMADASLQCAR